MQQHWPKDEQIFSWDPENMDKYWELCEKYDTFPAFENKDFDVESQQHYRQMKNNFLRQN